ncbi:MAG: hypothetical protein Q8Q32_00150 [bacterium]|nr:hypothetical protein [bacterium]
MRGVVWLFVVLLVLAMGIVGFFWYQAYTAQGLVFDIEVPDHVQVGVPFEIELEIANDSGAILQDAILSMDLPEDMVFLGKYTGKNLVEENLGNLGEGSVVKDSFPAMVVSGESSLKRVSATISYLPSSLGARFERTETGELRVSDSGVLIDLESPAKVFSGEEFELEVSYENNSEITFADLLIELDFPESFELISSTMDSSEASTSFFIGNLESGKSSSFTIVGRLNGPDNAFFDISALASAQFFGQRYDLSEQVANVSISPSPLSLQISINERDNYVVSSGDELDYSIIYRNNTSVGLRDVIVKAVLNGEMFDFASIDTEGGAFNSGTNTITWNAAQISDLATIAPGQSGQISFSINTKDEFPITRISDKNFVLKVDANIESETVPEGVASKRTVGSDSIENKIAGQLNFYGRSYFNETDADIENEGVHPPIVGQTTEYTIHWILENTSTDMENIAISAFLGPNVIFTGESRSSTGISPSYNSRTSEMTWEIQRISATTGIISDPVEAIFQLEFTPGIDQVNSVPVLVKRSEILAKDVFTGNVIEYSINEIKTAVSDPGADDDSRVQQ